MKDFPGYFETVLDFIELEKIINSPEGNIKWKISLSAIAGIYLIVDRVTGLQYVGSAYGKEGIWGRWKQYANSGHGGNALLEELLKKDNNYKLNFQFSIMQTLPKNLNKDEVIGYESFYKHKLGSRAFGLNAN